MATIAVPHDRARTAPADFRSSTTRPIRLSGLGLILGGFLIALFPVLHPNHDAAGYASPLWVPVHLMPAAMSVLALFGLMGIFAHQGERNGRFGTLAFVVAVVGTAAQLTGTDVETFILPFIELNAPQVMQGPPPVAQLLAWSIGGLVFAVGYLLQGIAIVRAGVLPRGAGALLGLAGVGLGVAAAAGGMLPPLLVAGALGFGLALAWIGYSLWSEPGRRVP